MVRVRNCEDGAQSVVEGFGMDDGLEFFVGALEVERIDGFSVGVAGRNLTGGRDLGVGGGQDWRWWAGSLWRGCRCYRGFSTSLRFGRNDSVGCWGCGGGGGVI